MISLIAAVDEQNGLGKNNQLLCHLPADLKYFKAQTLGKTVIMGRKTFESIGRPLPNRRNIILSRTLSSGKNFEVIHELSEIWSMIQADEDVMVIGGADIYRVFLPFAKMLYLTRIHHQFDADVFFPHIDQTHWQLISSMKQCADQEQPYDLTFEKYICH